ncbi:hypothetical protein [Pseudokineococcus sp. 1T1Z-3]|uniref:hypothetical protein n=1 Tax=Pseudokineococcus sp. 1T1Z-3 TaxID=3132745 RepID=UPI0030AF712F
MVQVPRRPPPVLAVALALAAGFAASACLLTALRLDGDPGSAMTLVTRGVWVLGGISLTAVAAMTWWWSRGAERPVALLVGVASTALWTVVALAAGWDPVR